VAITLTSHGNSAVFKSNEPDYLKDPWLSAPRSRGVWLSQTSWYVGRPVERPCLTQTQLCAKDAQSSLREANPRSSYSPGMRKSRELCWAI